MSTIAGALQVVAENPAIDKGIYLGFHDESERFRYKEDRHVCLIGPSGKGKSCAIGVPNFTLPRSIICLDPKGQLAAITARLRASFGKNIILNPYGLHLRRYPHLKSHRWNPLAQLDPKKPSFAAKARAIAQACVDQHTDAGNHEYFNAQAENILAVFCMWERDTKGEKASLRGVVRALASGNIEKRLAEMIKHKSFAISLIAERILSRKQNKSAQSTSLEDVIDTILKNLAFIIDDDVIAADMDYECGARAIDFAALHREITTIYVILPVNQLERQAKWLRMFLNLAYEDLFAEDPPEVLPRVLMMLDEIGNLGRMPQVLRALQIGRDYRLQVMTMWQNLQQMTASYEKEWSAFFSSAGALTLLGARDWHTAELISKMLGKRQVDMTTFSKGVNTGQGTQTLRSGQDHHLPVSWNSGSNSGTSVSTHIFDLLPPEDVMRIEAGETINFIEPVMMPVKGMAPGYWKILSTGLLDPNPYYRG